MTDQPGSPAGRGAAAVLAQARTVADDVLRPLANEIDRDARWPAEGLGALRAAGLGGLVVGTDVGGHGLGLSSLARVCETLGTACASTALCFGMHCVASAVIAVKATGSQRREFLEPIAAGAHLTTLALSEPGTGSQFWLPQTTLARVEGGFRLEGEKSFVTNGGYADSYVVSTVAAEPDAPPGQFSCVLVPAAAPGLEWGGAWEGLGMRGNSSRALRLTAVPVPDRHPLGEEGDQILVPLRGRRAVLSHRHGRHLPRRGRRGARGRPPAPARPPARAHGAASRRGADPPAPTRHRLRGVARTCALVHAAAAAGDAGAGDALALLASAKAEVAHCAVDVAGEAMSVVGGMGYREHSPVDRHLRDARAAHVMAPTTDVLRVWAGRALLDLPLLGE